MKILRNYALIPLAVLSYGALEASNVATQTVTFSVSPISEIAVSGDPSPLLTYQASAGTDPACATDNSTFYAVTSNGGSEKIVVNLDSPMPVGTTLSILVGAPNGAVSTGTVGLTVSNQNAVTGVTQVSQSSLPITYMFESTSSAGVVPITTRIVTFTLSP